MILDNETIKKKKDKDRFYFGNDYEHGDKSWNFWLDEYTKGLFCFVCQGNEWIKTHLFRIGYFRFWYETITMILLWRTVDKMFTLRQFQKAVYEIFVSIFLFHLSSSSLSLFCPLDRGMVFAALTSVTIGM
jgi:hypothetical protein